MMKKYLIFILSSILLNIHVFSQTYYYGKHHFGQLEILTDSICTVSFFKTTEEDTLPGIIDTCYYTKSNDTIFITSRVPTKYEIIFTDTPISLEHTIPAILYPVKLKPKKPTILFAKTKKQFINYRFEIIAYDTIKNQFILNKDMLYEYCFFRYTFFISSSWTLDLWVKIKNIKSNFLIIKLNTETSLYPPLFLNSFPLLIKGNRLIPFDRKKQDEFWSYNLFYFPVMKKSKQKREYKIITSPFQHIKKVFDLNYYPHYNPLRYDTAAFNPDAPNPVPKPKIEKRQNNFKF